jgi:hypothetical protein
MTGKRRRRAGLQAASERIGQGGRNTMTHAQVWTSSATRICKRIEAQDRPIRQVSRRNDPAPALVSSVALRRLSTATSGIPALRGVTFVAPPRGRLAPMTVVTS